MPALWTRMATRPSRSMTLCAYPATLSGSDVASTGEHLAACLAHHLLGLVSRGEVCDGDGVPVLRQPPGKGLADAGRSAGDDGDLARPCGAAHATQDTDT